MRPSPGRVVGVVALLGLTLLFVALAAWQVERRAWKHALIARVEQRVQAAPVDAPGRERWSSVTRDDDEYRHVRVDGTFVADHETFVQAATIFGSGYWAMVPLRRDDGSVVLIDRGYVATAERARLVAVRGHVTVTGLLRASEPGGRVVRRNDLARDRWFSRDVEAIARARGLSDVAPYFIDADADPANAADAGAGSVARGVPVGGLTVVAFADNHLLYAIVWSMLAALVAGAAIRVARGPATRSDAP